MLTTDRDRVSIKLSGQEFEPWRDGDWARATPARRRAYWQRVGELARQAKREELRRGVDIAGRPFRALAPATLRRRAGDGPVLSPRQESSRFQRLCRTWVGVSGVTVGWSHGWARIVGYHAFKRGRRALPVRNAVGLTQTNQERIKKEARRWWRGEVARLKVREVIKPPRATPGVVRRVGNAVVSFLAPGQRPNPRARTIQVYTDD